MARQYCSFLVRCWSLASGQRRVRVEYVQTGEVLHTANLEDALVWMDARIGVSVPDFPPGRAASPVDDSRQPPPTEGLGDRL